MTESAARLVDHVLPRVPVRQWVLSLPYRLRYLLAWNHDLCRAVLGIYVRAAILDFFRRLAHEIPWSASLCATAFLEAEVVEISRTVGRALVEHYGCRPEWGAMNYVVHEEVENEEAGETEKTILRHLRTPGDVQAAEEAMREMHALLEAYAEGLARKHRTGR